MAVGEIFLSAFLRVLLNKLASPEVINFLRRDRLHTTIQKWTEKLETIRDVVDDAEEKQITEAGAGIKRWLEKLEDLAYDVDDMLDLFATETLSRKQLVLEHESSKIKDLKRSFSPSAIGFKLRIRSKIEEINGRLEDIHDQRTKLGLERIAGKTSAKASQKRDSTALVNESYVCGRDDDRDKIIKLLLDDEATNKKYGVISIVGMGGVGKTTLAQLVYNHKTVQQHFHSKAWICVSDDFNIKEIMKTILRSVSPTTKVPDQLSSSEIQIKLNETLTEKKFLVVLDDVWNHKPTDWDVLWTPFGAGAQGSRVIVTTRKTEVALQMESDQNHRHYLKELSKDDCWLVFKQYAFENINITKHQNLESIGKKIAEKCKGLPLAARTLGGILRSKPEKEEWEKILDNEIWDLRENESDILPALRLSYYHLPPHLKRCFAYCSILPKDYEFSKKEIVLLWMAEGFLQQQRDKRMEDLGLEYFGDLLSASFFQKSTSDTSLFVMHDLINDLAQWVAGEKCFLLGDNLEGNKRREISKRARHSSYVGSEYDGIKKFRAFDEVEKLRTFLPLRQPYHSSYYLTNYVPFILLPKLRCLRVLSLNGYISVEELPNSIGDLKHLRFLDLSRTSIIRLPEWISTLYNLQTLILRRCRSLKKLPEKLSSMFNLRHLNIAGVDLLKDMPVGMDKLTSLQTMTRFVVGEGSGSRIRELGKLVHLRGNLRISELQNVTNAFNAKEARLNDKQGLTTLMMKWSDKFDGSRNESVEAKVIDMLQPHKNLKELIIWGYGGTRLPNWIGDPIALSHLRSQSLYNCVELTSLPPNCEFPFLRDLSFWKCPKLSGKLPDHLPSLETLYIYRCPKLSGKLPDHLPSLETLKIIECPKLSGKLPDHLPSLEELIIEGCPKLSGKLPDHLPSLETLKIIECEQLVVSILRLPKLQYLHIRGCQEVELPRGTDGLSSLKSMNLSSITKPLTHLTATEVEYLTISGCDWVTSLWGKEVGFLQNLTSLRHLKISSCPKLVPLVVEEEQQGLLCIRLESLQLGYCENREKLRGLHSLTSLRELTNRNSPRLVSLVGEEVEEEEQQGLPCTRLESLTLYGCGNLEKLRGLHSLTSLRKLTITNCPRLESVAETDLPSTLRELSIGHCPRLESVAETDLPSTLRELSIGGCSALKSLRFQKMRQCLEFASSVEQQQQQLGMPSKLESLHLYYCDNLEELQVLPSIRKLSIFYCKALKSLDQIMMHCSNNASLLEELNIDSCDSLTSLPSSKGELPATLKRLSVHECPKLESVMERLHGNASLETIYIWSCESLKSLPEGLYNLNSLQQLSIGNCAGILSFPEEGFPTNLTRLRIGKLKISKPLFDWELHGLTSLQELEIWGPCPDLVSFPEKEKEKRIILPTSLTKLNIGEFPNLEYLSFNTLQSLTSLWIINCPKLKSFLKDGLSLSSLEYLEINDCPNLKSFPKEGLPLSLLQLRISRCPLLERRCEGRDWPKIAHIPRRDL